MTVPPIAQDQHTPEEQAADTSSDFQKSPESRRMTLSPDSPKLPDIIDSDASTTQDKNGTPEAMSPASDASQRRSAQLPFSPEKPLMERRSLVPNLRVDTVNSQQYATKELQLIRKMKEQNRLKSEAKQHAKKEQSRHEREDSEEVVANVVSDSQPVADSKVDDMASEPLEQTQPAIITVQAPSEPHDRKDAAVTDAKVATKKAHRNSADSSMSGIVWSAVVEKFSEMAQEIAGGKASNMRETGGSSLAAPHAGTKPSTLASSMVAISESSASPPPSHSKDPENIVDDQEVDIPPVSKDDKLSAKVDAEEVLTDSPDAAVTVSNSPAETDPGPLASSSSETLIEGSPVRALRRRSKSFTAISIMKKPSKDAESHGTVTNGSIFKSGKYDVVKLKRGRTVRVQSHHATNVEGDYAAFLKEATGEDKSSKDGDASSLKSGKSGRSGKAWSTKSGVENGCFRRGSMRSIKTGKTIATVGDVPIRDLSRGARFRHPNPFFQQSHGFRKIKAPYQAGPGMLRRKGSKIVRLSVYEGRSAPRDTSSEASKRKSDDGETLGSALARMKDSKKKGPTPLIGELSFENNDPAKPRSKPTPSPSAQQVQQPVRQGPLALSKDNLAAYAASSIGISSKPPSDPGLAQMAYAASAFASNSYTKPASSIGPGSQPGFPFPMPPASLPPVPMVSARGFPQPGLPGTGSFQPPSNLGMRMGPSSTLSGMSTSRSHILGAQLRGAQMLGASQSTISVASNRSATSHKRNKSGQGPPKASPGVPHGKKGPQGHSGKTPTSVPMSRVEDSFISMTPARSDMSVKSSEKGHGDGRRSGPAVPHAPGSSSMPSASQLPMDARASYKDKNAMRSSTLPLPPLPGSYSGNKPLPLREADSAQPEHPSRTSAHRPVRSLTVDTDSAKEQGRKQMHDKQMAEEHKQNVLAKEAELRASRASAVTNARSNGGGSAEFEGRPLPFGGAGEPPKSGTSPFAQMASAFTPKRPKRKDSASELPMRVPRPPSAGPLDPALDHFSNAQTVRRDSTASNGTSVMSKSKGINRIFGLKKNKIK
ncbi:hypothetical protein P389DRAFT_36140 [Cystobasidium minutum MCA 4210]|uniref:uncharacterized protein n=1 Tax=Cystobasidium minutum MCA 4210 TaxID=1397322 RepID=UPI0034CE51A3|eukprot:jgi/Rhomi1/36140/CE36139_4420